MPANTARARQRANRAATTAQVKQMQAQTEAAVRARRLRLEQEQQAAHTLYEESLVKMEAGAPLRPVAPTPLFSRLISLERQMKLLLHIYRQLQAEYEQVT